MAHLTYQLIPFGLGAVALVLVAGLFNMLRGGSANLSQKLMRWRVVLQFITVVVVMLTLWLAKG